MLRVRNYHRAILFASHHHFLLLQLLLRDFLLLCCCWFGRFCDGLVFLRKDDFNVAWTAQVRVNATVSSVCASAHLRSAVNLDVFDNQMIRVKTLELGIALSILQHLQKKLCALLRPSTLCREAPLLRLCTTSNTTCVPPERNTFLVRNDILQESDGTLQVHVLQRLRCLPRVLVVNTQMRPTSLGRLGCIFRIS